ncbi:MAG: hypothetical protein KDC44_02255 [Phaeodactylibacter sp.]|nr:hypothetical protein [Phaeodactylibacter sp.]
MVGSKVLTLLNTLSISELNQLQKYLSSPYFNENSDLLKLFEILTRHLRTGKKAGPALRKAAVWKALYGKMEYKDIQLRRINSELTGHVLEFMGLRTYQDRPFSTLLFSLEAVNQPRLDRHFDGLVRKIQRLSETDGMQDPYYHFYQFKLEHSLHTHLELSEKKISSFEHLENADFQLDCFYYAQKLKNYCDLIGYQKSLSAEASIRLFPGFLDYVEVNGYLRVPVIRMYFLVAKMLLRPEEEAYFFKLKDMMEAEARQFLPQELKYLFIHIINYCIDTKINNGRSEYFQELFAVYRIALEEGIIFEADELPINHYKNIITVGLHVSAFAWIEQFIQQYTGRLPKEHQENALNYNLAKVYFHQGKYDSVIELLREVEYENLVYALGGKLMLLKTYYELQELAALDSLMDSFRIYLRRNKRLSREAKQQYLNVLRFVKKLSNADPYDKASLQKLQSQIEDCKALADKVWIMDKMRALV